MECMVQILGIQYITTLLLVVLRERHSAIEEHYLNPDKEGWNFRHIFGSFDEKDRHYNTPRVWYGHHLFNPEIEEDPESGELPFI